MPNRKKKIEHATVIGLFANRSDAEAALRDLRAAGFADDKIGLVARNASGEVADESGETYADEGAMAGAVAGAGVGTLIGIGVLSGVIPVIGPAIAAGVLGTLLTNAVGGAAVAGIAGALVGWGIPEDDASYYENEVKAGRYLVTVDAGDRQTEAWDIVRRHGGYDKTHAATAATDTRATTTRAAAGDYGVTGPAARTMRLKEEQLHATKTPVTAGEVNVRKEVVTEQKQITVPVEREEVVIERRPVRGKASSADIHAEEIRIPVKEEKVSVTKEAVVTEEVTVGKRKVQGTETVSGTVRKEEVRVEEEGDVTVKGSTTTRGKK